MTRYILLFSVEDKRYTGVDSINCKMFKKKQKNNAPQIVPDIEIK